jgi:protein-S-isoprenylcysteine O-methyltransferase Ste14
MARPLWVRILVFLVFVPGTAVVAAPIALAAWAELHRFDLGPWRWLGVAPIVPAAALWVWAIGRFARQGSGTPAPWDPPVGLVSGGPYARVRNPMYVAAVLTVLGQAVLLGSTTVLVYATGLWVAFHLFVTLYEEPTLRRTFGQPYERYLATVPRWIPRLVRLRSPHPPPVDPGRGS